MRSPIPKPIGNVDVVPVVMDPVGPKVLLVDDQEFNVKILADLMTMLFFWSLSFRELEDGISNAKRIYFGGWNF